MKQEPFTSLSFPLERYSYATQKDEPFQKHSLSNIQWLHYPHRDLEIQFEMNTVAGHDEVIMKVVRDTILFEQLNITRLSQLKIPLSHSENGLHQSGIVVITRFLHIFNTFPFNFIEHLVLGLNGIMMYLKKSHGFK